MTRREQFPSTGFPNQEDWEELWAEMEEDERNPRVSSSAGEDKFGKYLEPDYDALLDES